MHRRDRERQEAEASAAEALGRVSLGEDAALADTEPQMSLSDEVPDARESSNDDSTIASQDAARRDFPWFGQDKQAVDRLVAEGIEPERARAGLEAAQARLQQVAKEAHGDPDDERLSPWSTERAMLDRHAVARLVSEGATPEEARERVEYATDKDRFDRAVARGTNPEDAMSAVEGARLVQRRLEERAAARAEQRPPRPRPSGDITADTDGELIPRYDFVLRRADRLTIGDLLQEPRFGQVRVRWIADAAGWDELRGRSVVQVFWMADDGGQAARMFRVDERLLVRVPDLQDANAIERALDRSRYQRTDLDHKDARLIAAHLQAGPSTLR